MLVDAEVAGAADDVVVLKGSAKLLVVGKGAAVPSAAVLVTVVGGSLVSACSELFLPGADSSPCATAKLEGGLADAGPAKLGV